MGPLKSQTITPSFEKAPRNWEEIGFVCEATSDQSPTLRALSEAGRGESMHHSGGAWSESELIYGEIIKEAFARLTRPRILSVGLGLGYNEVLVAQEALRSGKDFELWSFEIVPQLVSLFKTYVYQLDLGEEFFLIYEKILSFAGQPKTDLVLKLQKADRDGDWICQGNFLEFVGAAPFNVVLYDAFSSKTNPQLWEEKFLADCLAKNSAADSLFASYACTGALKRALRTNSFEVEVREGFQGKRNSTRARRGLFGVEAKT